MAAHQVPYRSSQSRPQKPLFSHHPFAAILGHMAQLDELDEQQPTSLFFGRQGNRTRREERNELSELNNPLTRLQQADILDHFAKWQQVDEDEEDEVLEYGRAPTQVQPNRDDDDRAAAHLDQIIVSSNNSSNNNTRNNSTNNNNSNIDNVDDDGIEEGEIIEDDDNLEEDEIMDHGVAPSHLLLTSRFPSLQDFQHPAVDKPINFLYDLSMNSASSTSAPAAVRVNLVDNNIINNNSIRDNNNNIRDNNHTINIHTSSSQNNARSSHQNSTTRKRPHEDDAVDSSSSKKRNTSDNNNSNRTHPTQTRLPLATLPVPSSGSNHNTTFGPRNSKANRPSSVGKHRQV
ncbi:hypothetical protein BGW39_007223 [Mortierella sp. 14UC]|nr:hypothetical protein BGW39_007223 [Mortierella sp. 14UC]